MTGPSPADFAAAHFTDPALAAADPVLGPDGRPLAHRGRRGVVFQRCPATDDRGWAVKCYPAADPALADRYARVAAEVRRGRLPFAVPCRFLPAGARVGGKPYPAAVLDWVEGVPLNQAVRERAGNPAAMHALFRAWGRVAAGLRATGAAHGELAHDNVLVTAGADPIRLVDYDSFHLPGLMPAADAGHPNYAHPAGAAPADRDRFPLLVIATALRAVTVLGRDVWDQCDTGDNLLFAASDFRDPGASTLFDALIAAPDPTLRTLAAALRLACAKPAGEAPRLDDLLAPPAAASAPAPPVRPVWRQVLVPLALLAGVLMIGGGAVAGLVSALLVPPAEVVEAPTDPPPVAPPAELSAPKPPADVPPPVPARGAVGFHKVWAKTLADAGAAPNLAFTPDGAALLCRVPDANRIDVYAPKTGAVRTTFRGAGVPAGAFRAWAPEPGRVALYGPALGTPSVWDVRTGARLPDPFPGPLAPGGRIDAAGRLHGPDRVELSPDGRYVFAANSAGANGRAPYLLTEAATRRVVRAGTWPSGDARFTADGARLLVTESGGRTYRLRLPVGQVEAEWVYPANSTGNRIHGLSADGGVAVLRVRHGDAPGTFVADGRTGQLLRRVETAFHADALALAPDGGWLLGVVADGPNVAAQLTDARTGSVLVQSPLGKRLSAVGDVALAADLRALAVFDPVARELTYYALRGDVPAATAPVPEPVAAAPNPPPDFPQFPQPAPRPAPAPPVVEPVFPPVPVRPALPPAPALRPRWTAPAAAGLQIVGVPQPPLYAPDGKTVVLSGGADGTVLTFKAATGLPGPVFDGHKGRGGTYWLAPFADKVVSRGFDAKLTTWDAATGRRADDLAFADLPPADRGHTALAHAVSPTGRYTAVARRDGAPAPGPLRVLDTTTGKVVVSAGWGALTPGGHLAFTRDESKLFVLDGTGMATWYKLPSGEAEAQWAAGDGPRAMIARVLGASADGRRMIYNGPAPGHVDGVALVDGATGAVVSRLPAFPYQPGSGAALSPDGRVAAVAGRDPNTLAWYTDVLAADGWRVLGRIAHPPGAQHEPAHAQFSPDGKDVAVFFRGARQLAVFPVPDAGPAAAIPDRPPPLVERVPPRPAPAADGGLVARWTADVPTGGTVAGVYPDARGRVLVANTFTGLHAVVDARTGAVTPGGAAGDPARAVVPGGRGEAVGADVRDIPVIDPGRARRLAAPIPLPDLPDFRGADTATYVRLSADRRYLAAGRRHLAAGGGVLPVRVLDRATEKVVVSTEWGGGTIHFTADGTRVLLADHSGRGRWFKLPTGEPGGAFDLPRGAGGRTPEVTDLSADGRLLGYTGPVIGPDRAPVAVADATTGQPVRTFGAAYLYTSPVSLSADGRLAAVMRAVAPVGSDVVVEVVDVASGAAVGRATVTTRNRSVPTFRLTPDGRALVVHDYSRQQLHWFDLPPQPEAR